MPITLNIKKRQYKLYYNKEGGLIMIPVTGKVINICKTTEEWNRIKKGQSWNYNMGSQVTGGTVIHYNYIPE